MRCSYFPTVPPELDLQTNVLSNDILIVPQTGVLARIYRPNFVFLNGDSAGANIALHLAFRIKKSNLGQSFMILGIGMIHPYFWKTNPIGSETVDRLRKELVDKWWLYVCPSDKECDDPFINMFVDRSSNLVGLACHRILVTIADKDILKDIWRFYYDKLVKSGWRGKAEIMENEGEDHVFHIFNPDCDKAKSLMKRLAAFLN
ncbi:hypothetical protein V6Z11_A03G104700 [Gossypium hirsutum]